MTTRIQQQQQGFFFKSLLFHNARLQARRGRRRTHGRRHKRAPSIFDQRLLWDDFCCRRHGSTRGFQRCIRMPKASFDKLLMFIQYDLEVDPSRARCQGGIILPELCLYCTLQYCGGGSYSDIKYFTGISTASFYNVVWKCIDAINKCPKLAIKFPQTRDKVCEAAKGFTSIVSSQGCIWNCVSAIDGYHLQINTPSKSEVKNVRS